MPTVETRPLECQRGHSATIFFISGKRSEIVVAFFSLTAHEAELVPALPHGDLLLREVDVLGAARADAGHLEGRSCGSMFYGKLEQKKTFER